MISGIVWKSSHHSCPRFSRYNNIIIDDGILLMKIHKYFPSRRDHLIHIGQIVGFSSHSRRIILATYSFFPRASRPYRQSRPARPALRRRQMPAVFCPVYEFEKPHLFCEVNARNESSRRLSVLHISHLTSFFIFIIMPLSKQLYMCVCIFFWLFHFSTLSSTGKNPSPSSKCHFCALVDLCNRYTTITMYMHIFILLLPYSSVSNTSAWDILHCTLNTHARDSSYCASPCLLPLK